MDKQELKELVDKKTTVPNIINVATTWVSGGLLFKPTSKWSKMWMGVCHYSDMIWAISPIDYQYPTMVTTIFVSSVDHYCERAYTCLYFKCFLNKFNKNSFIKEFKDCGKFTLGLPSTFGEKTLWFNEEVMRDKWKGFKIPITGGILRFDESKMK